MSQLSFLVFCEGADTKNDLVARLEATGHLGILAEASEVGGLADAVLSLHPDVLVLDLSSNGQRILDRVEKLPAPAPALLVCGPAEASSVILRSMRLGAEAYLTLPLSENELGAAIERIVARSAPAPDETRRAATLAVLGAKGGVGTTTVACELARALATGGAGTSLLDLDLDGGDVALHFDRDPRFSLADARERGDLDRHYLETLFERIDPSLRLLCAPRLPEDGERVGVRHLERALAVVRDDEDFVVLDLPSHLGDIAVRALDEADLVLLVTTCDVASLLQARRRLELMKRMGFEADRLRVIVNRLDRKSPMSLREIDDFLGHPVAGTLPNVHAVLQESQNTGQAPCVVEADNPLQTGVQDLVSTLHDWLGLARPASRAPSGAIERVRRYVRSRIHGAD